MSTREIEMSVKKIMKAVWAVLYHCVIHDDKSRHRFCPDGEKSWCSYKRTGKKVEDKPHYLDPIFLQLLKPIFKRLSDRSLLLRCLPGYSQNQNECLNSVVWSKAPKHKFKGPKAVEMAGMSAVLQFDCGQRGCQEVMKLAEILMVIILFKVPRERTRRGFTMLQGRLMKSRSEFGLPRDRLNLSGS